MIAGGTGLVGTALTNFFLGKHNNVVSIGSKDVDLTDSKLTRNFIEKYKPDLVIDSAAKVGGILANDNSPVDFFQSNMKIQMNLMESCFNSNTERFIFLASSCIYPKFSLQPIKEEYLHSGKLEETNFAYAVAKIAGIELIRSYRKQYKKNWISVIPTNVYGPNDNFDLTNSHVIPALIRKFSEAKDRDDKKIELWGTGISKREFIFSSDLAEAIYLINNKYDHDEPINVGTGTEVSIYQLAELVSDIVGFKGEITWDKLKPDGTPRKILDISKLRSLGWKPKVTLEDGIAITTEWFRNSRDKNLSL